MYSVFAHAALRLAGMPLLSISQRGAVRSGRNFHGLSGSHSLVEIQI